MAPAVQEPVALRQHSRAKDLGSAQFYPMLRCGHMMAHCGRLWLWLAGLRSLSRHLRGRDGARHTLN
jgi:hypothetical protein